ncbi:ribosome biogenesis GTPase [Williamsoniiplasma luminosum]|uniref:Small ribosomal subunit biogenesis GTPase RsgA n=1 Tax=Williamsoniiplasma luminosum TaxID=214888 RepID=A0A2K8NTG5_9MOLU|nr:ribosome small subunit-dependent GTPase A [Williamsoniiplasma luminosum]ATZ17079.1 ribosome biogenesis GTPase [Williamsoniiplasma luminosum]
MNKGVIVKIGSNTSHVLAGEQILVASLKGGVLKDKTPLVGDIVEFEMIDEYKIMIVKIEERKTELYRPKIANVNQVGIVASLKEPKLDHYVLLKMMAYLNSQNIETFIIFTKKDLLLEEDEIIKNQITWFEKLGIEMVILNNKEIPTKDFKKLEQILKDKITVLTGQTGAGKSTTINHFLEFEDQIKTQTISKALNRGKHTTTSIQLYKLPQNILLADTPGFSSFEIKNISAELISSTFTPFQDMYYQCKFRNCLHVKEKGCYVKQALENNELAQFIYDDYKKIISEIKPKKETTTWKK